MGHYRVRWAAGSLLLLGFGLIMFVCPGVWNSPAEASSQTILSPQASAPAICGGFEVVTSFNYPSASNRLNAVAALAPDNVWAVGDYYDGVTDRAVILHWTGSFWGVVQDADPGSDHEFFGITALAPNNIWAVGSSKSVGIDYNTLVEHWDGTSWSIVSSPNTNGHTNVLNAVAGASANDVWAVGYSSLFGNASHDLLIEHWNGSTWTIFPIGAIGTGSTYLDSVAVVNANDVWAVGLYQNGAREIGLALHWNGTVWQVVPVVNPGTVANSFSGVSVLASNNVWVAGQYRSGSGYRTLIEQWNGTTFNVLPSANPSSSDNFFEDLSALSANDIWAVGDYFDGTNYETMAQHWDGSAWSLVPSTDPGTSGDMFHGVVAIGPVDVWAVGDTYNPDPSQTLTEHYTGCPPTPTATPTITPTPIPTCPIPQNYVYSTTTNGMAIADTDIGNHGDDVVTNITLPFSYTYYNQAYDHANVSSNGNLQFVTGINAWDNVCLPASALDMAVMPYWDDLETLNYAACPGGQCGIYVKTFGSAPNRIFVIEWRAVDHSNVSIYVNFEILLYEGVQRMDFVYGAVSSQGGSSTVGLQQDMGSHYTSYSCNTPALSAGLDIIWTLEECVVPTASPTGTATHTPTATSTSLPTQTPGGFTATPVPSSTRTSTPPVTQTRTSTQSPTSTPTQTPGGPTPTICPLQFSDVLEGSTFYPFVRCLACRGIINGYPDGTFRPNNDVSRGQLSKIVSNSAGFADLQPTRRFEDVPVGSTFQVYIGRLASREYISGYPCGGPGEPCVGPDNLPYFRPASNASRGQISKIDSNAARFTDLPTGQQFEDVAVGSTYYTVTYRLVSRSVMSGYPCGGPGEPCVGPDNLPYFRPTANATRGQTSKIVSNTFFPDCQTPAVGKK